MKLREFIVFGSRVFLLVPVFCLQSRQKKIVASLATPRAHQLDVAADTDEVPISPHLVEPFE